MHQYKYVFFGKYIHLCIVINYRFSTYFLNYRFSISQNFEIKKNKNEIWMTTVFLRIYSTYENTQTYRITGKREEKYL